MRKERELDLEKNEFQTENNGQRPEGRRAVKSGEMGEMSRDWEIEDRQASHAMRLERWVKVLLLLPDCGVATSTQS